MGEGKEHGSPSKVLQSNQKVSHGHRVESALSKRSDIPEMSGPSLLRSYIFRKPAMALRPACVTPSLSV